MNAIKRTCTYKLRNYISSIRALAIYISCYTYTWNVITMIALSKNIVSSFFFFFVKVTNRSVGQTKFSSTSVLPKFTRNFFLCCLKAHFIKPRYIYHTWHFTWSQQNRSWRKKGALYLRGNSSVKTIFEMSNWMPHIYMSDIENC